MANTVNYHVPYLKSKNGEINKYSNDGKLKVDFPLSAFGEIITTNLKSSFNASFVYDELNPNLWDTFTDFGGVVSSANSLCNLDITNSLYSYAVIRSKKRVHYKAGLSSGCRFTCLFNNGVNLMYQATGIATSGNGYQIGVNGNRFGVLRAYGGKSEIRVLTITGASSASETANVELNGITVNVNLTNAGGDVKFTAYELGKADYSSARFYAYSVDDKVIFSSVDVGAKNNAYSFSSGTATGTIAQTTAGTAKTNDWTYQEDFNYDKLDGTGKSGMEIDITRGNVYQIEFQWLGFGAITFSVEDPNTGEFIKFHQIKYANNNTNVSTDIPSFPFEASLASLGSTTSATNYLGSVQLFTNEDNGKNLLSYSKSSLKTVSASSTTNLLYLLNPRSFRGYNSQVLMRIKKIGLATDLGKLGSVKLILNPATVSASTTADYKNNQFVDDGSSVAIFDTTSSTYTGGTVVLNISMGKTDSIILQEDIDLEPTESLLFVITTTTGGGGDAEVSVVWEEIH